MAYGVNVLKGQVTSVAAAQSAASADLAVNTVITTGFNVLTGQIKSSVSAISAGALDVATNVVLT
jgi:hypothetical protein